MKIMKATAVAPSNIAFTKYWGKKEGKEGLRLPTNGSISMNLSNMLTTTTVECSEEFDQDTVTLNNVLIKDKKKERVIFYIDKIREMSGIKLKVKVTSKYNFPLSSGLSSSASGFAALSLAATKAFGLDLSEKDLSILARQGSGSACRSIPEGFVEWLDGDSSETSYAVSLFPPNYWDIADVVVIVNSMKKNVPTSEAMRLANTSPLFNYRLENMKHKNIFCKKYIQEKDFTSFGELIEAEALEMHSLIMTSHPPLIFWIPETLYIMHKVREWRRNGIEVYFTINTGHNIHLIIKKKDEKILLKELALIDKKYDYIVNYPSKGAYLIPSNRKQS